MKFCWYTVFLSLCFTCTASAAGSLQSETLYFDARAAALHFSEITGHKGLKSGNQAIVDDDLGYVWVGTQDGLVRLDGYESKRYAAGSKSKNALVSNYIATLAFDKSTRKLWIGSANGLSVLNLETEQFQNYKHDKYTKGSLSDNVVQSIYVDSRGKVWVGTKEGLNLYDPKMDSFRSFVSEHDNANSLSHNNILDIKEDGQGSLWIATQNGLSRYSENDSFERFYPFKNDDGSYGLVTKIAIDKRNKLWLGTEQNGIIFFDPQNQTSQMYQKKGVTGTIPSNYIRSLLYDKNGDLWVGTSAGVSVYDIDAEKFITINSNSRLNGNIVALHQDENDMIWLGTWSKGLHTHNPRKSQIGRLDLRTLKTRENVLTTIANGFDGDIWFANQKFLYRMQADLDQIEKIDIAKINPASNRAIPFVGSTKQKLYLLTDKIYELHENSIVAEYELPEEIRNASWYSATLDEKGRLWLVSRSIGIHVLSDDFKTVLHDFQSAIAGYVRQIDEKTMLIGSLTATYWIDINSFERITHLPENTRGMLNPNVTGYLHAASGEKWLATSGGIHKLVNAESEKRYYKSWTTEDGLPTDVLTGPMEDSDGKLWFGSTNGLIRFDPKDDEITHYNENFGALTIYYIGQYLKDAYQRMFFQGPRGISIIDEAFIRSDQTKYELVINEFSLQDAVQGPGAPESLIQTAIQYINALTLPAEKRDFTFGFTTTYRSDAENVQYFYRLIGFDNKWLSTDSKNRRLKYTNLDPGKYRFEIYSVSPNGTKGDVKGIDLIIKPFFYETLWFKFAIVFVLFSIFLIWYKYRMYKIKKYNQQLELQVQQRTQDIKTLADIAKDICFLLDMNELVQQIYIHLNKSLEVSVLAVGVYESEKNRIKFERSLENGKVIPLHYRPMEIASQLAAWCVHNSHEIILKKYSDRFKYLEESLEPVAGGEMETVVYIPIRSRSDEMLGCITVQSQHEDAYDANDLEFIRTISNYTGIALDNAIAHSELKRISSTDFLTGLPNRRAFIEQAEYQIKVIKRLPQSLSFAMADLDNFKSFNDKYGHECGDYVLKQAAKIFREHIREGDLVGRWGGEEFIFMLPNTNVDGAHAALEKLRQLLEKSVFKFQSQPLRVTVTFGIAVFSKERDMDDAINCADLALYRGKQKGRNRVELYDDL